MEKVCLQNDQLRLVASPAQGAGVLSFEVHKAGNWLPVMPVATSPDCDLKWANFIMLPYSNRIDGGAFTFQGRSYQLEKAAVHAIHGDVRHRPWVVEEVSPQRLSCRFDSRQHEGVNWPWPFAAWAEYWLEGPVLSARLQLSNCGQSPMPAGGGWHPYFSFRLTRAGEPVHVQLGVEAAYPDGRGDRIPSGPAAPLSSEQDFRRSRALGPEQFFDTCFAGYDGGGHIAWPDSGVRLGLDCTGCSHLILYNPGGKPYFAVEPVLNANDGVNLLARGEAGSGVQILEPGAWLEARFNLRLEYI
ncbi:MAG: hypothetical protein GKR89_17375 [Candidatus Latescibacteria bacterium]|nr:hypothetical protein [Candidatus Latescibacterota bacterium]